MAHRRNGVARRAATAGLGAIALITLWLPATSVAAGAQEDPVPVGAAAVTASASWSRVISSQHVSTSSPVLVANGGAPFVATGDRGGNIRAFDLATGTPVPGWGSTSVNFGMRAPLSSDGTNVYVPVAQDGIDRYPRYRKFSPSGQLLWDSNPSTVLPPTPATGFLLSGLALTNAGGTWRGVGGSSGQWIYGLNGATGAKTWQFRNADSTMATPALADLYGSGSPQVVTSNDTTAEFPGDRHGGILRILTADGRQICTATQLVDGSAYAASGYNNSSPAVGQVDGAPVIVFGSTGPVQTGAGGNQVVAYDSSCRFRWASPPLAAQVQPSPTLADVRGTGGLQVAQVVGISDGANTYPRVYVLDASTGAVIDDTGTALRGYGAPLAFPPSIQLTTADVNRDGAQDLFVPAQQGRFLILDGRTLDVIGWLPTNLVVQNTPIVTATADGVRVTLAGYSSAGGIISSYVINGAALGERGWTSFGNNPQLAGVQGEVHPAGDQMLEGQTLSSGAELRTRSGSHRLVMQTDGNLVVRRSDNSVQWQTGTSTPGSTLLLRDDGVLVVRTPGGATSWSSSTLGFGTERLVLDADGTVRVWTGFWTATRRLTSLVTVWSSTATGPTDRLPRGRLLGPGASIVSPDRSYTATMQTDGNLVFRRGSLVVWHSGTRDASRTAYARFNADGNLTVTGQDDRLLFSAQMGGRGGVATVAKSDGTLQIVTASGAAIWSNGVVVK